MNSLFLFFRPSLRFLSGATFRSAWQEAIDGGNIYLVLFRLEVCQSLCRHKVNFVSHDELLENSRNHSKTEITSIYLLNQFHNKFGNFPHYPTSSYLRVDICI